MDLNFYTHPSRSAACRLLQAVELPYSDLTERDLADFLACGAVHDPAGIVGLEIGEGVALLRSLAVAPSHRGGGVGSELVRRAERYAASRGVDAVYLLTPDAEGFFRQLGYRILSRERAPAFIRRTREFYALCPASAAFMVKHLDREARAAG